MKKLGIVFATLFIAFASYAGTPEKASTAEEVYAHIETAEERNEETAAMIKALPLKERVKIMRLAIEDVKSNTSETSDEVRPYDATVGMYILAVLLPPVAVALHTGLVGQTLLNVLLTIIGWLPGVVHAFIVLAA